LRTANNKPFFVVNYLVVLFSRITIPCW